MDQLALFRNVPLFFELGDQELRVVRPVIRVCLPIRVQVDVIE